MRALAVALVFSVAPIAQAQPQVPAQSEAALKARCAQLIAYYDRFAVGRSTDSDGRRNHTRIGASIDCAKGRYAQGIAAMEALLTRRRFTVPPPGPDVPEDDD